MPFSLWKRFETSEKIGHICYFFKGYNPWITFLAGQFLSAQGKGGHLQVAGKSYASEGSTQTAVEGILSFYLGHMKLLTADK